MSAASIVSDSPIRVTSKGMCMSSVKLTETVGADLNVNNNELGEICGAVELVIERLYKEQWELFEKRVSEWPISFQFYYYMRRMLARVFRGYQMDGEYNHMTKGFNKEAWKKEICFNSLSDRKMLSVRPDFIIHRRSVDLKENGLPRNILWVELKRHDSPKRLDHDHRKLKAVTRMENIDNMGVSGYKFGLSLLLRKFDVRCEWFQRGKQVRTRIGKVGESGRSIEWSEVSKRRKI